MDADELRRRTKRFGIRIIELVESLPNSRTCYVLGNQLLRSGTSVGANYRSACRGKSKPDFISKLTIAIEEADESLYWLEMLTEARVIQSDQVDSLMKEANELVAILTASAKTAKESLGKK